MSLPDWIDMDSQVRPVYLLGMSLCNFGFNCA